jgi:integrase
LEVKTRDTLRPDEVLSVLRATPPEWQNVIAFLVYTGARKGEALGLRREDVDLEGGGIIFGRSHGRNSTKGKRTASFPSRVDLVVSFARLPARMRGPADAGRQVRCSTQPPLGAYVRILPLDAPRMVLLRASSSADVWRAKGRTRICSAGDPVRLCEVGARAEDLDILCQITATLRARDDVIEVQLADGTPCRGSNAGCS